VRDCVVCKEKGIAKVLPGIPTNRRVQNIVKQSNLVRPVAGRKSQVQVSFLHTEVYNDHRCKLIAGKQTVRVFIRGAGGVSITAGQVGLLIFQS
jgi:hypothetical protein